MHVVFFVVPVSAVIPGWTLLLVAEEREPDPPVTLKITSPRDVDADIVEYTVGGSPTPSAR